MKGWRMRVQCHVPSPLIPRPSLFTTTWSRHVNKDTRRYWVESKHPSAHFLSSLAFYRLSTESQWNFPLRDPWVSKTLTFPARKKWCSDVDVSCLPKLPLQSPCPLGYCNDKLHSKGAIECQWQCNVCLSNTYSSVQRWKSFVSPRIYLYEPCVISETVIKHPKINKKVD